MEDEVNEDSAEQIKPKQYPCVECEYERHTLAQPKGAKGSLNKRITGPSNGFAFFFRVKNRKLDQTVINDILES